MVFSSHLEQRGCTPKELRKIMSEEEIKSRHSKELKALEGEKRAQLKKAKGTAGKGQKAKDILAA